MSVGREHRLHGAQEVQRLRDTRNRIGWARHLMGLESQGTEEFPLFQCRTLVQARTWNPFWNPRGCYQWNPIRRTGEKH